MLLYVVILLYVLLLLYVVLLLLYLPQTTVTTDITTIIIYIALTFPSP